jgi:hypothetical protein
MGKLVKTPGLIRGVVELNQPVAVGGHGTDGLPVSRRQLSVGMNLILPTGFTSGRQMKKTFSKWPPIIQGGVIFIATKSSLTTVAN